jgi:hypothetical protein
MSEALELESADIIFSDNAANKVSTLIKEEKNDISIMMPLRPTGYGPKEVRLHYPEVVFGYHFSSRFRNCFVLLIDW